MLTNSYRIWTRVVKSISYNDNHYTKSESVTIVVIYEQTEVDTLRQAYIWW